MRAMCWYGGHCRVDFSTACLVVLCFQWIRASLPFFYRYARGRSQLEAALDLILTRLKHVMEKRLARMLHAQPQAQTAFNDAFAALLEDPNRGQVTEPSTTFPIIMRWFLIQIAYNNGNVVQRRLRRAT